MESEERRGRRGRARSGEEEGREGAVAGNLEGSAPPSLVSHEVISGGR